MVRTVRGVVATVFAVTLGVMSGLYSWDAGGGVPGDETVHASFLSSLAMVLSIGVSVMLCWRHRWPVLVTGLTLVPPLLTGGGLPALFALAALAANRGGRVLWGGVALVFAVTALSWWYDTGRDLDVSASSDLIDISTPASRLVGVLVVAAVLTAIPVLIGVQRRTRLDLARQQNRERALRDEMTRREERSRIAHEMHDALGHRLSLLSLQAGALEVAQDGSPRTGEVARTVRTTARQSLEDLRQVIGVLRDGRQPFGLDESGTHGPQPGVDDVPELVARSRQAGLAVDLTMTLDRTITVPAPLGTAVFRIVQESLTNVVRHAPGLPATVTIHGGPGFGVTIEVINPLPAVPPAEPSPGSGSGLTGIAERAALLGGNASAGPNTLRQFAVRAWLPWAPAGVVWPPQ